MTMTRMKKPIQPMACGSCSAFFHSGVVDMPLPQKAAQRCVSSGKASSQARRRVAAAIFCHSETHDSHAGRSGSSLFADAEIAENHVEDVLYIDPAGEPPEGAGGDAQLLGQQILACGEIGRQCPQQSRQGVF